MSAEAKLSELGIELPPVPAPGGLYAPCVRAGDLLFVAGQIPYGADGKLMGTGKLGRDVTIEQGYEMARRCALQALAVVRGELGSLDNVVRAVRVAGFVASAEGFTDHPKVINGASQVLIDVFGDSGRHARIALGAAELPAGVPVEVEFAFQVR